MEQEQLQSILVDVLSWGFIVVDLKAAVIETT